MDNAIQVDLARSEAPAEQVMDSALGRYDSRPRLTTNEGGLLQHTRGDEKEPVRGRSETTSQVRLGPKISHDRRSRSRSTHGVKAEKLEQGSLDDVANVYALQPADEGFGAWSYVASAFAMFIVVWG